MDLQDHDESRSATRRFDLNAQSTSQNHSLATYVKRFLSGDTSAISFFDDFFGLSQGGRSLSRCSSLSTMFAFLFALLREGGTDEISIRALMVINEVLMYLECKQMIMSPEFAPIMCETLISLLEHPNKQFAQLALATITTIISRDDHHFCMFASAGLFERIRLVGESDNPELRASGQVVIGSTLKEILQLKYAEEQEQVIWDLIMFIVHGENEQGIRSGLACMKKFIESKPGFEITPDLLDLFLRFSETAPSAILDMMFALLSSLVGKGNDEVLEQLHSRGFYVNLLKRVEAGDRYLDVYVFKFLACVPATPDSHFHDIILSALGIIANGSMRGKSYALMYLCEVMSETPLQDLPFFMVNNNFLTVLSSIVASGSRELIEPAVHILTRVIDSLITAGFDLKTAPGIEDLLLALTQVADEEVADYETPCAALVSTIENALQ